MAAFIYKQGAGAYLRTREIHIDSSIDKENENQSDFQFDVILKEEIQNVVSITLTSWNLDKDITPSFWPQNGSIQGNNMLDIELSNINYNSGTPFTLSIEIPNENLYFDANAPSDTNVCNVITDLLIKAKNDYDEAGLQELTFSCPYLVPGVFSVFAYNDDFGPLDETTTFTLLFGTGPNAANSCYKQLGFEQQDYDSINGTILGFATIGSGISQGVVAPNPVDMQQFKYIDVGLRESNKLPVQRIFTTNPSVFRNQQSASTLKQQKIDTDQPPRVLKKLSVFILYPGLLNPSLYVSNPSPVQFTFTILQVAQESDNLPSYMRQTLAM